MGFRSNRLYSHGTQLANQVEEKKIADQARIDSMKSVPGSVYYDPTFQQKSVDKYGADISSNQNVYDPLGTSKPSLHSGQLTMQQFMDQKQSQYMKSQQELNQFGPAGAPNIIPSQSNVPSTFSQSAVSNANAMYGNNMERNAAVNNGIVPSYIQEQANSPIAFTNPPGSAYSALDTLKNSMKSLGDIASSGGKTNYSRDTKGVYNSMPGLAPLPTDSTGSNLTGSYSNPSSSSKTPSVTINNTPNSENKYDFLENPSTQTKIEVTNPHMNSYTGAWKKDNKTYEARIQEAKDAGKVNKAARIQKKYDDFKNRGGDSKVRHTLGKIAGAFKSKKNKKTT